MDVQRLKEIQLLVHHLPQIRLYTYQNHYPQPKQQRLRHTFSKFNLRPLLFIKFSTLKLGLLSLVPPFLVATKAQVSTWLWNNLCYIDMRNDRLIHRNNFMYQLALSPPVNFAVNEYGQSQILIASDGDFHWFATLWRQTKTIPKTCPQFKFSFRGEFSFRKISRGSTNPRENPYGKVIGRAEFIWQEVWLSQTRRLGTEICPVRTRCCNRPCCRWGCSQPGPHPRTWTCRTVSPCSLEHTSGSPGSSRFRLWKQAILWFHTNASSEHGRSSRETNLC